MQHPYKRTRYALKDQPPIAQCEPQNNWQFGQTSNKADVNQQRNIVRQRHNCRQIGGMTMRRNGELRRIVALASALGKACARPRFATVRLWLTMRSPRCVQLLMNPSFERRGSHASLPERRRQKKARFVQWETWTRVPIANLLILVVMLSASF